MPTTHGFTRKVTHKVLINKYLLRELKMYLRNTEVAMRLSESVKSYRQGEWKLTVGRCRHHQVQTLMKQQDLRAIQPKSYVPKTTNSHHNLLGRSPNLLLDRKLPSQPNQVFVGDITARAAPIYSNDWWNVSVFGYVRGGPCRRICSTGWWWIGQ